MLPVLSLVAWRRSVLRRGGGRRGVFEIGSVGWCLGVRGMEVRLMRDVGVEGAGRWKLASLGGGADLHSRLVCRL